MREFCWKSALKTFLVFLTIGAFIVFLIFVPPNIYGSIMIMLGILILLGTYGGYKLVLSIYREFEYEERKKRMQRKLDKYTETKRLIKY